eukprot:TRINITY_DN55299_c0_g1_i2.p1 TRINITY_DN55299_c0_g1~~TRINITY_DN55299_c0_g1_i2.p1  ORF type:complete len:269 (+),score=24.07 TRINITY_DN55299_c0_g1_i2:146-952(+)
MPLSSALVCVLSLMTSAAIGAQFQRQTHWLDPRNVSSVNASEVLSVYASRPSAFSAYSPLFCQSSDGVPCSAWPPEADALTHALTKRGVRIVPMLFLDCAHTVGRNFSGFVAGLTAAAALHRFDGYLVDMFCDAAYRDGWRDFLNRLSDGMHRQGAQVGFFSYSSFHPELLLPLRTDQVWGVDTEHNSSAYSWFVKEFGANRTAFDVTTSTPGLLTPGGIHEWFQTTLITADVRMVGVWGGIGLDPPNSTVEEAWYSALAGFAATVTT